MTSIYRTNYHLRSHKRDGFIEFIKSLLLTPFVLAHSRPVSSSSNSNSNNEHDGYDDDGQGGDCSGGGVSLHLNDSDHHDGGHHSSSAPIPPQLLASIVEKNVERYSEIFSCIEDLIDDHIHHQKSGIQALSRLAQLVPTVGTFFTRLPLKQSFLANDKKRSIAARTHVPPSFNDIRHILNTAQVTAIASTLRLITFDGDMTLYADGADFAKDNALVGCLVKLLQLNLTVAIVTAAGYGVESERYEKRLSGLLQGIQDSLDLDHEQRGRFFVMGGECNYLFRWDPALQHLVYIPENEIHATLISKSNTVAIGGASLSVQTPPLSTNTSSSASTSTAPPPSLLKWASNKEKIAQLVNVAHSCLVETVNAMGVTDRVEIIRKERAVGLVVKKGCEGLTREQLDEVALSAQRRLRNFQHVQQHRALSKSSSSLFKLDPTASSSIVTPLYDPIPFCAFNGGSDVWVDIGNKLIGVQILQEYLGPYAGNQTLHVGDQFLSTGNDLATRSACCTTWITSPKETYNVLMELESLLLKKNK